MRQSVGQLHTGIQIKDGELKLHEGEITRANEKVEQLTQQLEAAQAELIEHIKKEDATRKQREEAESQIAEQNARIEALIADKGKREQMLDKNMKKAVFVRGRADELLDTFRARLTQVNTQFIPLQPRDYVWYPTQKGKYIRITSTKDACGTYGYEPGQRVRTPAGDATVIGECNKKLWFHIDGRKGVAYWPYSKSQFQKKGFRTLSEDTVLVKDQAEKLFKKLQKLDKSVARENYFNRAKLEWDTPAMVTKLKELKKADKKSKSRKSKKSSERKGSARDSDKDSRSTKKKETYSPSGSED